MAKIKIGINGFGRMGRLTFRAAWEQNEIDFVHINDPAGDAATLAHLLNFDSVHGRWNHEASAEGDSILIDGQTISTSRNKSIAETDWSGCDLVIEASGKMNKKALLQAYLDQGVKRVVVTAPVKEEGVLNLVMGVNDDLYNPEEHRIVTAASCTTNCLIPILDVIGRRLGIESGVITTIHSAMHDQPVIDAYNTDLRKTRSALQSIIPVSTSLEKGIGRILPELEGKFETLAIRVPTTNVSIMDISILVNRETEALDVNNMLTLAAESELKGILGVCDEQLVSCDFNHDPRSAIVDLPQTRVSGKRLVKIQAWFDNEWGYSNRMLDTTLAAIRAE
jgi:glyceraldehyde 3-phosphate dehydrogenase